MTGCTNNAGVSSGAASHSQSPASASNTAQASFNTKIILTPEAADTAISQKDADIIKNVIVSRLTGCGFNEYEMDYDAAQKISLSINTDSAGKNLDLLNGLCKAGKITFCDENNTVLMDNSDIKGANVEKGQNGENEINLFFTDEGAKKLADITAKLIGQHMDIYMDGSLLTSPAIIDTINGGQAAISPGDNEMKNINNIAVMMNSGALPYNLKATVVK
jgi:preprotein translocase subunit SecD